MASIKFGGGITEMRGSIAGNVFARNRFGAYSRARTKPINPKTARQIAVRSSVAYLAAYWTSTVTAAQRTAWDLYGASVAMKNRLGESVYLTGFNHFVRSNVQALRAGLPIIAPGPTLFELPGADPTLAVTMSAATQQMSVTFDDGAVWANETGARLFIEEGKPQNAARNFFAGPWRYAGVLSGVTGSPIQSPQAAPSVYAVAVGQRIWLAARILRADGRLSEAFTANCFCAA